MFSPIEVDDTCEVTRVTHVHSIGDSSLAWLWVIDTRLKILIEDVVGIIGSDKSFYG